MNRNVLFVDDEPNLLDAYRRQMRKWFQVETALGARRALELLAEQEFAVVISDMRMPDLDGIDFLSEVARRWPNIARVMLTGNADVPGATQAVQEGRIFRFLTKPCEREALLAVLDAAARQYAVDAACRTTVGAS